MLKKDSGIGFDLPLILAVVTVVLIGCLLIYSAGFDPLTKLNNGLYRKQILWLVIGIILFILISMINYQFLGDYALHVYIALLVILILTTFLGKPIRNTRAWIDFGAFSIQPSEFMKLSVVIVLAKLLELRERDIKNFRELLIPAVIVFVPVLIILKQPDFGTASIFIPILFALLFVGGADISHLVSIISIAIISVIIPIILTYQFRDMKNPPELEMVLGIILIAAIVLVIVAAAAYGLHLVSVRKIFRRLYIPSAVVSLSLFASYFIQNNLKTYQKERILVFLNPERDALGFGYNVIQSKIAVGSGGFFGKGFLKGTQTQLGFLPEKTSDFIFAVMAEEWGFIGAIFLLFLLGFIIFRGLQIAIESKDRFGSLLASGITAMFFSHILVNIGMVMGIIPVTGLPLTFISYGGSNLLMAFLCIGILNNISMNKFVN